METLFFKEHRNSCLIIKHVMSPWDGKVLKMGLLYLKIS